MTFRRIVKNTVVIIIVQLTAFALIGWVVVNSSLAHR